MAKRKEPPPEEGAPLWMVTFSDMTCQLMTFFILLISMSTISKAKFAAVQESLESTLGMGGTPNEDDTVADIQRVLSKVLKAGSPQNNGVLIEQVKGQHVRVTTLRAGVRIAVGGRPLFAEDSAELTDDAKEALRTVAELIQGYRNRLRVLGHADPNEGRPWDRDGQLDGHWRLGFERANSVRKFLSDPDPNPKGVGNKLAIEADRFEINSAGRHQRISDPRGPGVSAVPEGAAPGPGVPIAEGRIENRRVEIVVTEELVDLK